MSKKQEIQMLVDEMPDPDKRGMFTTNIDGERIHKAVAAIYEGGREAFQLIIEMLDAPGSEANVKPHYALHCVLNRALVLDDEKTRRSFCETLAGNLTRELSAFNKAYLCQELQWAGRQEAVAALGSLLTDPELVEPAAMALVAIGRGASGQFQAALPKTQGKCRLSIIHAMAALPDSSATEALMEALGDTDREVRLAAGAGLAKMGEAKAVDQLLQAADVPAGWERTQATKHCLVLAEKLAAAGKNDLARKIYQRLRDTRTGSDEGYIRSLAEEALQA